MAMEKIRAGLRCFTLAFRREVHASFRKPVIHWLSWCFPLILFFITCSNFSEGTLLELPVAAIDNDHSTLSRTLIRHLDAGSHASVITMNGDLAQAERDLRSSRLYAVLVIPQDFEADVLAGRQPTALMNYNALFYGAGFYSTQDFPGVISDLNSQYRSYIAARIGKPVPPLARVSLSWDSLFNASGSFIYYQQFAATVHLLQLFTVTCMIYVLSRSKPMIYTRSFVMSLLGKLLPYTLCYTTVLMGELSLLVWVSDARVVGNPFYMLCVGFFYVMAAQSLGILLFTFTGSALTAYTLIGMLVSIAMTYSGMVVPELSMPLPAQIISNLEPLTHALYAMFDIFLRQVPGRPVIEVCALLLLYPLVTAFLVRRRLLARLYKGETIA